MRCHPSVVLCFVFAYLAALGASEGQDGIRVKLLKDKVWTGEPVPMIVTLFSPGPFHGTASFDLPVLSRTVITTVGSPLVGSESVDGETMLTQRHEFHVFTQRSGTVTIPAFQIRFEGRKDFTSDPEQREVTTLALTFKAKRPPDAPPHGFVVAAGSMDIVQQWSPDDVATVEAGAVVQRIVKQTAEDTTAMLLPPLTADAIEGVRTYRGEPIVRDDTQRGESAAMRSETLKYQFEQPGTVILPTLRFRWWDTATEEMKTITLPGKSINVSTPPSGNNQKANDGSVRPTPNVMVVILAALGFCLAAYGARVPIQTAIANLRQRFYNPERAAAQRLTTACRNNDAHEAYVAALNWARLASRAADLSIDDSLDGNPLSEGPAGAEMQRLSEHLFARHSAGESWSGTALLNAVREHRRRVDTQSKRPAALPPLNPTD